nr:uncharacterized protein LOC112937010 [Oryza sativa Japonica Group]
MDQSAVSSLLGQLTGLLVDEAKLLGGVRGDVQFIKDEMESMQGFLLDAADAANNNSSSQQVLAWQRQVREVAYDSQKCIDHYVQTVGASRPSAGLLGSVQWLPQLVMTLPSRQRTANKIKKLKARAREVGERRQRYGVKAPTRSGGVKVITAPMLSPQQEAAEHARRRRAIADATDWVNTDAQHVMDWIAAGGKGHNDDDGGREEYIHWIKGFLHMPHFTTESFLTELMSNKADATAFLLEYTKELFGGPLHYLEGHLLWPHKDDGHDKKATTAAASSPSQDHHDADKKKPVAAADPSERAKEAAVDPSGKAKEHKRWITQGEKKAADTSTSSEVHDSAEKRMPLADVNPSEMAEASSADDGHNKATEGHTKELFGGPLHYLKGHLLWPHKDDGHDKKATTAAASSPSQDHHDADKKKPVAAADPSERAKEEKKHQIISWVHGALTSDGINIFHTKDTHGPRLLAIVTSPVRREAHDLEDEEPHGLRPATEIARRVFNNYYSRQGGRFDFAVWVNAEEHSHSTARLRSILQQVEKQAQVQPQEQRQHPSSSSRDKKDGGDETTRLQQEILKHLTGKKFLIFLADHQDETPWTQILPALPTDSTNESAVILSPLVQQAYQYVGWYVLSLFFLLKHSRYRVYFYSHLVATRNKAKELLRVGADQHKGEDLHDLVNHILERCRWDSFSSKMFLHALYANHQRSKPELENLLLSLNEFSTVSNARNMIKFCYDDLHSYKVCFQYLSIFPLGFKIRRTSLVRRWAAEGLIVGRDGLAATDEAERCFDAMIDRGLLLPADNTDNPSGKVKMCTVDPHVFSFIARLHKDDGRAPAADSIDLPPALAHRISIARRIQLSNKTRQRVSEGLKKQMDGGGEPQDSVAQGMVCGIQLSNKTRRRQASEGLKKKMDSNGEPLVPEPRSQDSAVEDVVKLLDLFPTTESGWIKVLDLEGCRGLKKKHLKNICNRVFQLKYLSLRNTDIAELPKEINKLQDLETFDMRGTNIESFPAKSIVLPKLARLLSGVAHTDAPTPSKDDNLTSRGSSHESFTAIHIPRGIKNMTSMQILSHVQVSDHHDEAAALEDLARLQLLWKLGVVIHAKQAYLVLKVVGMLNECLRSLSIRLQDGGEDPDLNNTPPIFSPPRSLASLSISGRIGGLPTWIQNLEQLSDITLCDTSLKDSDIKILCASINLRFIRLLRESYNQNKLSFEKGFRNLEILIIEGSGTISDVHFDPRVAPKLEKIVWSSTCKMENLGIDNLQGLKEIVLKGDCDLNRIRLSVKANPCHPNLTHTPTLNSPTIQPGEKLTFKKDEFKNLKSFLVEDPSMISIEFQKGAAAELEKIVFSSTNIKSLHRLGGLPKLKEPELKSNRFLVSFSEEGETHKKCSLASSPSRRMNSNSSSTSLLRDC